MNETQTEPTSHSEAGFTLIELLVVILIIAILAAIALPAFLGQRAKAQDSKAKSDARNMVSEIETCYDGDTGYVGCTAKLTTPETGLDIGTAPGQVRIVQETKTGYQIEAVSKSTAGGSNHSFKITHNIGGVFNRTCTVTGEGGCKDDSSW